MDYITISKHKKATRDAKFPSEWLIPESSLPTTSSVIETPTRYFSESELEITQSSLSTLQNAIKSRQWTAVQVATAFMKRATFAHQLTNCLTEVFFDVGLEMARELDDHYTTTGELKGPFHGIPVSLKDNLIVKGTCSSIGIASIAEEVFEDGPESVVVTMLRTLGCVFFCKTNIPTAMMMGESINNVWGETVTPFNRALSAGGSTGGEGALVAMRGSAFGIGGDIGGSLRIPAAFNGLFTLRATGGRLPGWGGRGAMPGFESVVSVQGPLTRNLEDLELYCKLSTSMGLHFEDPKMIPFEWRDVELPEKLTFAVAREDDTLHPWPCVLRGIDIVVEKLRAAGHEVIEWDATGHGALDKLVHQMYVSDGGEKIKEMLSATGEPFFKLMNIYRDAPKISVTDLWDMQARRSAIVKEFTQRWNDTAKLTSEGKPIDGILIPASAYAGSPTMHNQYCGYTSVFNGLDWPAGVMPITRCDKELDKKEIGYLPKNELDKQCYDSFDSEKHHGAAVSLQVVGRRYEDEKVLKMMGVIGEAVGSLDYWSQIGTAP